MPNAIVPEGELIPKEEESYNHTARPCRVGPDNKLYIQLGQPYNVPGKDKLDLYHKTGMMGIIRMDRDGKNREVYATGLRNAVGHGFQSEGQDALEQRQPGRRHGRRPAARRDEPHRQEGARFRLPLVRRRAHADERIQERHAAGRRRVSRSRAGRACRRSRAAVLYGQHVSREIPRRHLLHATRLMEPHRPRRARA